MQDMQGYEEQLLNAMYSGIYYFEICTLEQEVVSPMSGIARL